MSELKAFNSERIYWAVEQVEREAGDIDEIHLDDNLFYLKSEADKFIADLEEYHKMEVEQLVIEIVKLKEERRWRNVDDKFPTADEGYILVLWEDGLPDIGYIGAEDEP